MDLAALESSENDSVAAIKVCRFFLGGGGMRAPKLTQVWQRNYQRLVMATHPDKGASSSDAFHRVQAAWERISAPSQAAPAKQHHALFEDVDIDDVPYDEALQAFVHRCGRCRSQVAIECANLDSGVSEYPCGSCSMVVRVAFDVLREDADCD